VDGWMDGQRTDGWTDRNGRVDGWMDGWMDGWTDVRTDGQELIDGRIVEPNCRSIDQMWMDKAID